VIYLRSLVFILWMVVTVVPYAIVVVIASPFVSSTRLYWMCVGWLWLIVQGARVICGVRWRIEGMDNVPTAANHKAAVILTPKHQSTWETFALPVLMPHPLAYVFKRELLYVPFFGWAIGRLDFVHIDRSRRSEAWRKVIAQGTEIMAKGNWMIMFPEGTRAPRGGQGDYKTGATRLAQATGTPVVPIAVSSAKCWPRKSFLLRPGVIDIVIGQPIAPEGRTADDMMREVETWIEAQMRRIDPEAYTAATTAPAAPPAPPAA
jgi:1-acyl-sn-glycerol-3-phosphate acyltransferase